VSNRYLPVALRKAIIERAEGCCEYCHCQQKFSPDTFAAEHIIPQFLNGDDSMENLAFSCQGCNSHKATAIDAIDSLTNTSVPLYNPRLSVFDEHFEWNSDFTLLIGKTPTGRATIQRLQLNRPYVVNLRYALFISKNHPPEHFKRA